MNSIPEKYVDRPNLWRLACELSKFKDPNKAIDMLASILSNSKKDGAA